MTTQAEHFSEAPRITEAYIKYLQGVNLLVDPQYAERIIGSRDSSERIVVHAEMLMYMGLKRAIHHAQNEVKNTDLPEVAPDYDSAKLIQRITPNYMQAYDDLRDTAEERIVAINPDFLVHLPQPLTDELVVNLAEENYGEIVTASLTDGYGPSKEFANFMYLRTLQDTSDHFTR